MHVDSFSDDMKKYEGVDMPQLSDEDQADVDRCRPNFVTLIPLCSA
jgi:hypothetical protein